MSNGCGSIHEVSAARRRKTSRPDIARIHTDAKIIQRMKAMRDRVGVLLKRNEQPIAAHGEIGGGHSGDGRADIIRSDYGTNPTYILKRLKRDRPDLAEKVIVGELSANAAAIEGGWSHKPLSPLSLVRLPCSLRRSVFVVKSR